MFPFQVRIFLIVLRPFETELRKNIMNKWCVVRKRNTWALTSLYNCGSMPRAQLEICIAQPDQ